MGKSARLVLGVYQGHDANAALIDEKYIIAAAQEERFNREKHFCGFPKESINFLLRYANLKPYDVKYIAFANRADTVLVTDKSSAKGLKRGIKYLRVPIFAEADRLPLGAIENLHKLGINRYKSILNIDHHQAHASTAYRCSGWSTATIITLDGNGNNLSGTIYLGRNGKMHKISDITTQGSIGWFYAAVTEALGFRPSDEEGKTMGLAAYGRLNQKIIASLREFAPDVKGLTMEREAIWKVTGNPDNGFYTYHFEDTNKIRKLVKLYGREDVARCAQFITEEIVKKLVKNAVNKTGCGNLAVAGGVFYNVKLNFALEQLACVREIRPHPASGDSGLGLGAALEAGTQLKFKNKSFDILGAYLGPEFTNREVMRALKDKNLTVRTMPYNEIYPLISKYLQKGLAIGWFQGRMEYGPRALGNRSVLADPRDKKAARRLNLKLKRREWFMPFAPSILINRIKDYLYKPKTFQSPFMIKAFRVKKERRGNIAAATHVDGTVRPQTVSRKQNKLFYDLINQFNRDTGVPAVLNTSFNRHGLPMVCSPKDAIEHLEEHCVDILVINNIIIEHTA